MALAFNYILAIGAGSFLWWVLFLYIGMEAYGSDLFFRKDIHPIGQQFSITAGAGLVSGFLLEIIILFGRWCDRHRTPVS